MRWLAIILLLLPLAAAAQSDDESRLVRFIEDSLSAGAARSVDLQGFRGALSSEARLDRLTVADADGVWLEIENAVLNWNRAAVLTGRIQIEALTAERVVLSRLPVTEEEAPSPEATPFALPDLPVSVNIGQASIARLELGDAVLGQPVAASAEASLRLSDGAGEASVSIIRLDGPEGDISLAASYDNATAIASVDLSAIEAPGGLAVGVLNIPGAPSVSLSLTGEGPFDGFSTEFALATDGVDRFAGSATSQASDTGAVIYEFEVAGDLTPLLSGDADAFLGRNAVVTARAAVEPTGAIALENLSVRTAAVTLDGMLRLDTDRQPETFALTGQLAPADGGRLALPGGDAEITGADLTLSYDRAASDAVLGQAELTGLTAAGFTTPLAILDLNGAIDLQSRDFSGDLNLLVTGLDHDDPAIAAALGAEIRLDTGIVWNSDAGLALSGLTVGNAAAELRGDITATPVDGRLDLAADLGLSAADLSPFGPLVGQSLGGAVEADLDLQADILSGAFDARFTAFSTDLRLPDLVAEPLLAGQVQLSGGIARNQTGIALRELLLEGQSLNLLADGSLSTDTADLTVAARLADMALIDARLDGPVSVSGNVSRDGADAPYVLPDLAVETDFGGIGGYASLAPGTENAPFTFDLAAEIADLSRLRAIAGLPLAGTAAVALEGRGDLADERVEAAVTGSTTDLRIVDAIPAAIFAGETLISANVAADDNSLQISDLQITGQELTATMAARMAGENSEATLAARLRDARLLTPALPGSLEVSAEMTQSASGPYAIEASASGPQGMSARASGTATTDLILDLGIEGRAPLELANPFIEPRTLTGGLSFDLRLAGPPDPASLSGTVNASGARLGLPAQSLAVENLTARAALNGGSVDLDATGQLSTGGDLGVSGRIGLTAAGLPANLSIRLDQGRFVDPTLYEAVVENLALTLDGALTGASRLSGQVNLGVVEIRVPESGIGGPGAIPDIRHTGETAEERQTRAYAGLLDQSGSAGSSSVALDIGISAPGRIFLRGRGLDAELGGTLRVGGTAANVVPSGRFELIRGRLSILGQRLDLTEGSATLLGGEPFLSLAAESRSGDYNVTITIEGPASAPVVGFRSSPELPEDEVLAQLFFGRSIASLSPIQALQLADAVAGLAGGGSGVFTRLREGLGLDDLDIQTDAEGNAAVRAGRYLSENIYTDVTVDSDGTGVSLNIDLTPSITARGGVASDGESSVGVFFERDY